VVRPEGCGGGIVVALEEGSTDVDGMLVVSMTTTLGSSDWPMVVDG